MKKVIALFTTTISMVCSVLVLKNWMRRGEFQIRRITISNGDKEKTHYYATGANGEKVMSWALRKVIHFVSDLG